ncbi:MAG: hypothetical protein ABI747_00290 [Candidatus Moraniibacteriota bacterium]
MDFESAPKSESNEMDLVKDDLALLEGLTPEEKIEKLTLKVAELYREMKEAQQIENNTDRLNTLSTRHRILSQMLTRLNADKEAPVLGSLEA